ncbi:hypothetical protein [Streptomyces sp. NPDC006879]|uniref:hypothetical protein n=1 Tax=Streptomyces sp. NPDC006879 TaxID=3364767 RepID=UPI00369386FC
MADEIITEDQWKIIRAVCEKLTGVGTVLSLSGAGLDAAADALKPADGEDNGINASSQWLYYSTQTFKFDPSLVTFSPDLIEFTPSGISVMGKERISWKGILSKLFPRGGVEEELGGLLESEGSGPTRDSDSGEDRRRRELEQYEDIKRRIGRIEEDVRRRGGLIRQADRMARQAQGEHRRAFLAMRDLRMAELKGLQRELDRAAAILDGR